MIQSRGSEVPSVLTEITCSFKLGSRDMIRVNIKDITLACELHTFYRLFGKQAANDLFLSGQFHGFVPNSVIQDLIIGSERIDGNSPLRSKWF